MLNLFFSFQKLADHFQTVGDFHTLKEEFHSLRCLIATDMKDESHRAVLNRVIKLRDIYPALGKICMVALVLPMSTADCERSFSTMNRIKSILRNRLRGHP